MSRHALLIATGDYEDSTLSRLRAPNQDVARLATILEDPGIGAFDHVTTLLDAKDSTIRRSIEDLLSDRARDDLVLLYFSCHGLVDPRNRLFFATTDTLQSRPASTAISRTFVNDLLESCTAKARVLILDCCYSGAFSTGFKSARPSPLANQVGSGYVVLSASDAYEYAFEDDSVADSAPIASIFTDILISGLQDGSADLDGDGKVGIDELFRFVYKGVTARRPNQTPRIWTADAEPDIYLANVPTAAPASANFDGTGHGLSATNSHRPTTYNRNQMAVARGFHEAASLIGAMLGPFGRRVPVEGPSGSYIEAADPATLVNHFKVENPRDQLGVAYAADLVRAVRNAAGDGSATAVVLARAMVDNCIAAMRNGAHVVELQHGIEHGVSEALKMLKQLAADIESKDQIQRYAESVTGETAASALIAAAIDKVGMIGAITTEESNTLGMHLEITEGMCLQEGYISAYFVTDTGREEAVLIDPYLLVVNSNLNKVSELLPILEKVMESGRPLVVIAADVSDEMLSTLVVNKIRDTVKSVAVRAPGSGDYREALLQDLAILTGGQVVSEAEAVGVNLQNAGLEILGQARKVVVSKDATTIVGGAGDLNLIQSRIAQLRDELVNSDSLQHPDMLLDRLAKLGAGAAIIKIGAATESELMKRKQLITDALKAARIAVSHGLVDGGGRALRVVSEERVALGYRGDFEEGFRAVWDALSAPWSQLRLNEGSPVRGTEAFTTVRQPSDNVKDSAGVLAIALDAAKDASVRFLRIA